MTFRHIIARGRRVVYSSARPCFTASLTHQSNVAPPPPPPQQQQAELPRCLTQHAQIRCQSSRPLPHDEEAGDKGILGKLWDKFSIEGQKRRILMGERLFRSAQFRAQDPRWFTEARLPSEFRPKHALISMHTWFIHKRLIMDTVDPHLALLIQEELFDILWNDTRARIRSEGVNELTVNKHLKDAQQLTFLYCTHLDHAFSEHADDDYKRFEELAAAVWIHVLNRDEDVCNDQLKRIAAYVEYQHENIARGLPDSYFWEGRIPWGDMPNFKGMKDNSGKELDELCEVSGLVVLPEPWTTTLTDSGKPYYWNTKTNETTFVAPK